MDVKGAKALKERLGSKAAEDAPREAVEVADDAPPVYHWTGVPKDRQPEATSDEPNDERQSSGDVSRFSRLRLSFR
jgi:hypothetical protein